MRLISLLLLLALGVCGCKRGPEPGKVVEQFLRYADQGEYGKAAPLLTDRALKKTVAEGGVEAALKSFLVKGTLDKTEIIKVETAGSTAKVTLRWSVKGGPMGGGGGVFDLTRSGLEWKIDLP